MRFPASSLPVTEIGIGGVGFKVELGRFIFTRRPTARKKKLLCGLNNGRRSDIEQEVPSVCELQQGHV